MFHFFNFYEMKAYTPHSFLRTPTVKCSVPHITANVLLFPRVQQVTVTTILDCFYVTLSSSLWSTKWWTPNTAS